MALIASCQAALKGRFPLNGTYFQFNESFVLHCNGALQAIKVRRLCVQGIA